MGKIACRRGATCIASPAILPRRSSREGLGCERARPDRESIAPTSARVRRNDRVGAMPMYLTMFYLNGHFEIKNCTGIHWLFGDLHERSFHHDHLENAYSACRDHGRCDVCFGAKYDQDRRA